MYKKFLLSFIYLTCALLIGAYTDNKSAVAWEIPIPIPSSVPSIVPPTGIPDVNTNSGSDPFAEAAGKPASFADEPFTIEVYQSPNNSSGEDKYLGWSPVIHGRILGKTRSGDAVIVEVSSGGKVVQTYRVGLKGTDGSWCEDWNLGQDDGKLMTATGDLTFTFKYYDDDTNKERVIAKRIAKVVKAVQHIGSGKHTWKYGIIYDDLLGSAYINQYQQDNVSTKEIWMFFWIRSDVNFYDSVKEVSCRLEVNGQKVDLPNEFSGNISDTTRLEQKEEIWVKNDRLDNNYNFYKVQFIPKLYWGSKRNDLNPTEWIGLADHPGDWKLSMKAKGKVIREFKFKVANGMIVPNPEQDPSKSGFLNLGPNRAYLEVYFPNPNDFDSGFNPDAIRKGVMFGKPWVSDEIKNGMLKALPPAKAAKRPFPTPKFPGK